MNGYSDTGSVIFDDDVAADPPRVRQRTLTAGGPVTTGRPPRVLAAGPQVSLELGTAERRVWHGTEAGGILRGQLRAGGEAVAPLYATALDKVRGDLQKAARAAGLAELYRRAWGTA
jgi:hypothetical protein